MNNYTKFLIVLSIGELLAIPVFYGVRSWLSKNKSTDVVKPIVMGVLERSMLFFGLATGASQVLILFGTLKIGSMFNDIKTDKKTSDYFLIGNLVSVLMVLLYSFIFAQWKT